jgi:hypothetical protein
MAKKIVKKASAPAVWGGRAPNSIQIGAAKALSTPQPAYSAPTPTGPTPDPYAAAQAQYGSLLQNAANSAGRQYGYTLADSVADEGTTALDLGATLGARDPNADPSSVTQGSFDWNGVEATNPFSKAALLVRNYKQQQNRTTNSLAAQGQFGGALNNARSEDTFGFQQGQDSLTKALQQYLTDQARTRRNAGVTRDDTINQAGLAGLSTLLGS